MRIRLLGLILLVAVAALAGWAQGDEASQALQRQGEAIGAAEAELETDQPDLLGLRETLLSARRDAVRTAGDIRSERETVIETLLRLGEPLEGEAASVRERRQSLEARRAALDAALSEAELNAAEASRLLGEIAERRRDRFYSELLDKGPAPFMPASLAATGEALTTVAEATGNGVASWSERARRDGRFAMSLVGLTFALVFALLMAIPVRRWIRGQITARLEALEPLPSRRVLAAASKAVSYAVPALIAGFVLHQAVLMSGLIGSDLVRLTQTVWLGFLAVVLVDGAAMSVFAQKNPAWRSVAVSESGARWIRPLAVLIALVVWIDAMAHQAFELAAPSALADQTISAGAAVLLALLFVAISRSALWGPPPASARRQKAPLAIRSLPALALILALVLIVAASLGYAAAAHFLAVRLALLGGIVAVALAVRALLRETIRLVDSRFRTPEEHAPESERLLFFWIGVLIDVLVIGAALPIVFLLFGANGSDVRAALGDALFGFQIGAVRISILEILAAIAVFAALLAATRFVQRTAETNFFPRTRMDIGVQNSLKTLIGYFGLVIAFMTGVGMLGFDLSNLAIIAGALSVGIGFGLQSVVNNFVSGLILLFERPIKVGDWIVTTSGEGIVQRISVRSTEIETFDRSSIIVPNSELISSSVTNWTHKNKLGRVTVPVGVSYNEDPERILEILRQIPSKIDIVLNFPEPLILFVGFGDSSLDFEIRAFVSDVSNTLKARTAIRVAIFKAFREEGVEIPFPQRDLHLRTAADGLFGPERPDKAGES